MIFYISRQLYSIWTISYTYGPGLRPIKPKIEHWACRNSHKLGQPKRVTTQLYNHGVQFLPLPFGAKTACDWENVRVFTETLNPISRGFCFFFFYFFFEGWLLHLLQSVGVRTPAKKTTQMARRHRLLRRWHLSWSSLMVPELLPLPIGWLGILSSFLWIWPWKYHTSLFLLYTLHVRSFVVEVDNVWKLLLEEWEYVFWKH